jgi:hypothetical protein
MITFSPATLDLNEFVGTTGTTVQLLTPVPPIAIPPAIQLIQETVVINSVTATGGPSNLVITWSGDSFTFSSTFPDMFPRTLKYLRAVDAAGNKTYRSVTKFSSIESDYIGLYQYVPPSITSINIPFTVNYTGSISGASSRTWVLTIRYNAEYSNAAFSTAVRNGSGYKNALALYPEMSL